MMHTRCITAVLVQHQPTEEQSGTFASLMRCHLFCPSPFTHAAPSAWPSTWPRHPVGLSTETTYKSFEHIETARPCLVVGGVVGGSFRIRFTSSGKGASQLENDAN